MNAPASLTEELLSQLQGAPLQQIADQLGTNPSQAQSAVSAALPMLLGALGRNAAQPQGAADLFGALQRDHVGRAAGSGGLGDLLGLVLGGMGGGGAGGAADGASILGHILGDNQQRAEAGLAQATGLGANAGQLLQILAPIVMAFLAQRAQAGGMDAGGLGAVLGLAHAQVRQQGGVGGDLLGSLLDQDGDGQDGDGQVGLGDLIKIGGGLLGGRR